MATIEEEAAIDGTRGDPIFDLPATIPNVLGAFLFSGGQRPCCRNRARGKHRGAFNLLPVGAPTYMGEAVQCDGPVDMFQTQIAEMANMGIVELVQVVNPQAAGVPACFWGNYTSNVSTPNGAEAVLNNGAASLGMRLCFDAGGGTSVNELKSFTSFTNPGWWKVLGWQWRSQIDYSMYDISAGVEQRHADARAHIVRPGSFINLGGTPVNVSGAVRIGAAVITGHATDPLGGMDTATFLAVGGALQTLANRLNFRSYLVNGQTGP